MPTKVGASSVRTIVAVPGPFTAYSSSLGRIMNCRSGQFAECVSITALLTASAAAVHRISSCPGWMAKGMLPLIAFFSWLSVHFGCESADHALEHHRVKSIQH